MLGENMMKMAWWSLIMEATSDIVTLVTPFSKFSQLRGEAQWWLGQRRSFLDVLVENVFVLAFCNFFRFKWFLIKFLCTWNFQLCEARRFTCDILEFTTYGSSARGGWCPLKIAGDFSKIVSVLALRVTSIFIGFTIRFFLLFTDSPYAAPM